MIAYEKLEKIEKNCLDLLHASTAVTRGNNQRQLTRANKVIAETLRKIIIANEMLGKNIICVSGMQGVGKTTLMKNFYGLQEGILNVAYGRGEKLPVFFYEKKECKEPQLYAIRLIKNENGYVRERVSLSREEFISASAAEEDDNDTMYLEIWLPYTHIKNDHTAFMLLPGFEGQHNYWQNLVEFSVKCAGAAIFVCDESTFATEKNAKQLKKMKEQFGDNLIYALSHSDESSDDNEELKATCMKELEIEDSGRVICVGQYMDEEKNNKWIQELKTAIEYHGSDVATAKGNCLNYIYELIEEQIRPQLDVIAEAMQEDEIVKLCMELEQNKFLDAFDDAVEKRATKLEKQLEKELGKTFTESSNRLAKMFEDNKYAKEKGVGDSVLNKARRMFFGENVADIKKARERIEQAMQNEDGQYDVQLALINAVSQNIIALEDKNECKKLLQVKQEDLNEVIVKTDEEKTQKVLHDVRVLLADGGQEEEKLEFENTAKVMKSIVDMGTQYFSLMSLQEANVLDGNLNFPEVHFEKMNVSVKEVSEKLKKLKPAADNIVRGVQGLETAKKKEDTSKSKDKKQQTDNSKTTDNGKPISSVDKVAISALGMAGVDILSDGVLDAVPVVAKALGVSVPIAAGAVAVIMGGTIATAMIKDMNRLQRVEYRDGELAIRSIQSEVKSKYMDSYREAMGLVRERLEENLIEINRMNNKERDRLNVAIAINKIERELDIISKEVTKDIYDIRGAFRG